MARPCSICNHSERLEIDRLLLSGEPYRNIAKRFKLSIGSISRHREAHIGTDLRDVREAMEEAREEALAQIKNDELEAIKEEISAEAADTMAARLETCASFLDQLKAVRDRAANLLDRAESSQDMKAAGTFLKELREQIRLMAELEGKISQQPQVNILVNPEWIELKALIITTLKPYPEAYEALIDALP